jgi:hypothetical protein
MLTNQDPLLAQLPVMPPTCDKRALDKILAMFLSTTKIVHTHEFIICVYQ